jgi:hypothetical protein
MPPPPKLYTGPTVPIAYDPAWQTYTNLTPAQIAAFQAFPQDLLKYASSRRWLAETSVLPVTVTLLGVPTVLQIDTSDRGQARIDKLSRKWAANATATTTFVDATGTPYALNAAAIIAIDNAVTNLIEVLFTAYGQLMAGINAATPTITKRSQIDAAYATIAPNSPSAKNPGTP